MPEMGHLVSYQSTQYGVHINLTSIIILERQSGAIVENLHFSKTEAAAVPVTWLGRISPFIFMIFCIFASAGGGFLGLVLTAFFYAFGVEDDRKLGAITVLFFFFGLIIPIVWLIIARSRAKPVQFASAPKPRTQPRAALISAAQVVAIQNREIENTKNTPSFAPTSNERKPSALHVSRSSRYRVVDWKRALSLSFIVPFVTFMGLMVTAKANNTTHATIVLVVGVITWIAVLFTHLRGTSIDEENDNLSFPTLFFPRSIKLSELRDANAEFWTRQNPVDNMGDSSVKNRTVGQRIYAANLSGNFGARQIIFWSKKRRDQFLSHLREAAPSVRITMWR